VVAWWDALLASTPDPVVYDVGANLGYYSVRSAQTARAVYSFEPVAATFGALERNVVRNDLDNVTAVRLGLSATKSVGAMNLYSSSGNNSLWRRTLPPGHPLAHVGQELVELFPLDVLVGERGLEAPSLLKVDVEGAELDVLRGARRTLREHRPLVMMECGETTSNDAGYRRDDLVDQLLAQGYDVYGLAEDPADLTAYPHAQWPGREIANLLAVPAGTELPAPPGLAASRPVPSSAGGGAPGSISPPAPLQASAPSASA
jgi:FkbM family methyltransferase